MKRSEWKWAAHLLTAGNLFFGFWAILQVIQGNYLMACWLILFASICDGLDGKLARFTRCSSEIGIELDSLVDVVSFGVAPSVLLYSISFHKFGFPGVILASIPLFFGVMRLARFNLTATTTEKKAYDGLPIPMMANTLVTFILFNFALWDGFHLEVMLLPLVILLALLMLSHVHYDTMPRFTIRDTRKNMLKLIFIFAGIILVAIKPSVLFFPLMLIYVLKGLVNSIFGLHEEEELEEIYKDEPVI